MYPKIYQEPEPPRLPLPSLYERNPGTYWHPTADFVAELADYLSGKRLLEVFAGNGLLAGYLDAAGVDVTATSILSGMDAHSQGLYFPVENIKATAAVSKYGLTHDVLLMCWPTVTLDALHAANAWGQGRDIVFIGEVTDYSKNHLGGCATDEFFEAVTLVHAFSDYSSRNMMEHAYVYQLKT